MISPIFQAPSLFDHQPNVSLMNILHYGSLVYPRSGWRGIGGEVLQTARLLLWIWHTRNRLADGHNDCSWARKVVRQSRFIPIDLHMFAKCEMTPYMAGTSLSVIHKEQSRPESRSSMRDCLYISKNHSITDEIYNNTITTIFDFYQKLIYTVIHCHSTNSSLSFRRQVTLLEHRPPPRVTPSRFQDGSSINTKWNQDPFPKRTSWTTPVITIPYSRYGCRCNTMLQN